MPLEARWYSISSTRSRTSTPACGLVIVGDGRVSFTLRGKSNHRAALLIDCKRLNLLSAKCCDLRLCSENLNQPNQLAGEPNVDSRVKTPRESVLNYPKLARKTLSLAWKNRCEGYFYQDENR